MSELRDFSKLFRLDGKIALITGGTYKYFYSHSSYILIYFLTSFSSMRKEEKCSRF
jgi:hypothetical protein